MVHSRPESYNTVCPRPKSCDTPRGFNACHSKSLLWRDKNRGTYTRLTFPTQGSNQVSHIAGGFFTSWATREAQEYWSGEQRTWLHTRPEKIKSQIQFPIISVKNWSIDLVTILILIRQRERCWFPYRSPLKIKWPGVHIKYNFIPLINCMD